MSEGNDRLVAQGVQTYIGFGDFKFLFLELLLVSVLASLWLHHWFHWDYIAGGLGTFMVLLVVMVFRKLAMIFSCIMSALWGSIAGFFAYGMYAGQTPPHPVSWATVLLVGLFVFAISMGSHMYAIGFLRTATEPVES